MLHECLVLFISSFRLNIRVTMSELAITYHESSASSPSINRRKERGAIAAQVRVRLSHVSIFIDYSSCPITLHESFCHNTFHVLTVASINYNTQSGFYFYSIVVSPSEYH